MIHKRALPQNRVMALTPQNNTYLCRYQVTRDGCTPCCGELALNVECPQKRCWDPRRAIVNAEQHGVHPLTSYKISLRSCISFPLSLPNLLPSSLQHALHAHNDSLRLSNDCLPLQSLLFPLGRRCHHLCTPTVLRHHSPRPLHISALLRIRAHRPSLQPLHPESLLTAPITRPTKSS